MRLRIKNNRIKTQVKFSNNRKEPLKIFWKKRRTMKMKENNKNRFQMKKVMTN